MADVTLPQLGETVTEGTITQWFKQVGDTVAADEPLFEVSTDKVDTEVPSPIAGVVTEIRVPEGESVEVGAVVAVIGDQGAAPADAAPAAPAPEAAPSRPRRLPTRHRDRGRARRGGGPDPTAPPAPAPAAAPAAEAAPPVADAAPPAPAPAPPASDAAPAAPTAGEPAAPADGRLLSPVVRRLVNENGIDPDDIDGTGPGGRITREDVMDYIDANGSRAEAPAPPPAERTAGACRPGRPAPAPAAPAAAARRRPPAPAPRCRRAPGERDSSVKLSKIRQLTGDHMVMSKSTSPHAFSVVEVDFANVDATRSKLKADWKATEGFSLTYLPFIAGRSSTGWPSSRTSTPASATTSWSCTTTSTSASPSTSTTRVCWRR